MMLETIQRDLFRYFLEHMDPRTGLIADRSTVGAPASIAATGLALTCYPIAVERGWLTRDEALARSLTVLQFFAGSEQSTRPTATGHNGFYYHFLDMVTGARDGTCELSTIDTAILVAGIRTVGLYFPAELAQIAAFLSDRVQWSWVATDAGIVRHGWRPETGFLDARWDRGYSEALLLYVIALASQTYPIDPSGYRTWTRTFERRTLYGFDQLYAGPLFIHQMPQLWLDLRGVRDECTRELGFDYFENSRRATLTQRAYAIENPNGFTGYGEHAWGFTASDGPGPAHHTVHGVPREFFGYLERGAPLGPDDGTISRWVALTSLPFCPNEVIGLATPGFEASVNPTFPGGWVSPTSYGINTGPLVIMIENHLTGLVWKLWQDSPDLRRGLHLAGFR